MFQPQELTFSSLKVLNCPIIDRLTHLFQLFGVEVNHNRKVLGFRLETKSGRIL